ncbi:MAG: archease [Nanoarchaeota archaeon]|nr:archease [Nanoarchaeota archaeon]
MKGYKLLPDIAVADIAYDAYGKDLEELFTHAAQALLDIMVDVKTVTGTTEKKITLKNKAVDDLLFDFLNEIIFLKDTAYMVFHTVKVTVKEKNGYTLQATLIGEAIQPEKHDLGNDVKATTMHQFEVKKMKTKWKARIVVDI